jgi:hypothetical protein
VYFKSVFIITRIQDLTFNYAIKKLQSFVVAGLQCKAKLVQAETPRAVNNFVAVIIKSFL